MGRNDKYVHMKYERKVLPETGNPARRCWLSFRSKIDNKISNFKNGVLRAVKLAKCFGYYYEAQIQPLKINLIIKNSKPVLD